MLVGAVEKMQASEGDKEQEGSIFSKGVKKGLSERWDPKEDPKKAARANHSRRALEAERSACAEAPTQERD